MAKVAVDKSKDELRDAAREAKLLMEKHYYNAWDCGVGEARLETKVGPTGQQEKHSKLFYLYKPTAVVHWNGHVWDPSGVDNLVNKMLNTRTKHIISCLDVQPITDTTHQLITITGKCRYNDEVSRGFSHMVMVWKEKTDGQSPRHWIIHDNFRWTKAEE